jgi:predicted MPP superfamily phosphohydrolase
MWKRVAWSAIPFFLIIPFVPFYFRFRGVENTGVDILSWIAYLGLGFFSMLFILLMARDLVWLIILLTKKIGLFFHFFNPSSYAPEMKNPVYRRYVLQAVNLAILVLAAVLTSYGIFMAHRLPAVNVISIPIEGLPSDLDGFTIAQIADIHVGPTIKRGFVQKVVEQVNHFKPDVIVFTGDIADGSVGYLKNDVAPLGDLSAPYGLFFVTGNHEYYSGAEAWVEEMKQLGFTVLMNENRIIVKGSGGLLMAGIPDFHAGSFAGHPSPDAARSLVGAQPHQVKVLLAHQPRSIVEAAESEFDLQISGHTHGGQFFPWIYLVKRVHPYISGLHRLRKTWIYVSRGTGYWGPPIRLGVPSEITLIQLVVPT